MRGPLAWILAAVGIVAVIVVAALIGDRDRRRRDGPGRRVGAERLRHGRRLARRARGDRRGHPHADASESTAGGEEPQSETPQGRTGFLRKGVERGVQATETLVEGIDNAGIPDTEQGEEAAEIVSDWADSALNDLEEAEDSLDDEADTLEESLEQFAEAAARARDALDGRRAGRSPTSPRPIPSSPARPSRREHVPAAQSGGDQVSTTDWILIALEGLVVIGFIALGVRSGGIGLGLWGGVGTLVLVFGFGLAPGRAADQRDADHRRRDRGVRGDAGRRRDRLHGPDREQGAARAAEGAQLRRAVRLVAADDPDRARATRSSR